MSFTSDTWEEYSLFSLGLPVFGFSDGLQVKRPEAGAGGAAAPLAVIYDGKETRLWRPRDPGVWGSHGSVGVSPRPNGATPQLPWPHQGGKIILGGNLWAERCAFQSNSISLSLLPLSSLSPARAAWDVSVEVTCGEQCHVKSLWRLHQSPRDSNLSSRLFSSHLIFISEWVHWINLPKHIHLYY